MDINKRKTNKPLNLKQNKKPAQKRDEHSASIESMWNEPSVSEEKKKQTQETIAGIKDKMSVIAQPRRALERLREANRLVIAAVGAVVIIVIIVIATSGGESTQIEPSSDIQNPLHVDSNPATASNTSPFDPTQFYGLETADDELYFGRIVETNDFLYRMQDVFYESASSSPSSTSGRITLIKLGTEDFQPEDELVLPHDQVTRIFRLSNDSPILQAIQGYLE